MFQDERLLAIMEYLQENKRISADEICRIYGVSRDTARRDIVKLEEQGKIVRTRGAAILPTLTKEEPNYFERMHIEASSKTTIGKVAASLIRDGDYLYMDNSTTVHKAITFMQTKRNVVITNSIDIAGLLVDKQDIQIYMLGGLLHLEQRYVYGSKAQSMLSDYHVDKMIIGACGITEEGLFTHFEEEGFLIREAMRRSDQVIMLADHSKFGKRMFHRFADFDQIDTIVTDREVETSLREKLMENNVEIIVSEPEVNHE